MWSLEEYTALLRKPFLTLGLDLAEMQRETLDQFNWQNAVDQAENIIRRRPCARLAGDLGI